MAELTEIPKSLGRELWDELGRQERERGFIGRQSWDTIADRRRETFERTAAAFLSEHGDTPSVPPVAAAMLQRLEQVVGDVLQECEGSGDCAGVVVEALVAQGLVQVGCTCPVGFGQVADAQCPVCGPRAPKHTITGAAPGLS